MSVQSQADVEAAADRHHQRPDQWSLHGSLEVTLHRWLAWLHLVPAPATAVAPGSPQAVDRPVKGIRPRSHRDLGACARLLRVVHDESGYPVQWPDAPRAWLEADVLDAWVADRLGEILGHVAISTVPSDAVARLRWQELTGLDPVRLAMVSRLFVRPRVRRESIGTAMLDVAVAAIRRRGLVPVTEVVDVNAAALHLFEDRGWRLLAMDPWGTAAERLRVHRLVLPPHVG